jgi:hypothetical protein
MLGVVCTIAATFILRHAKISGGPVVPLLGNAVTTCKSMVKMTMTKIKHGCLKTVGLSHNFLHCHYRLVITV